MNAAFGTHGGAFVVTGHRSGKCETLEYLQLWNSIKDIPPHALQYSDGVQMKRFSKLMSALDDAVAALVKQGKVLQCYYVDDVTSCRCIVGHMLPREITARDLGDSLNSAAAYDGMILSILNDPRLSGCDDYRLRDVGEFLHTVQRLHDICGSVPEVLKALDKVFGTKYVRQYQKELKEMIDAQS